MRQRENFVMQLFFLDNQEMSYGPFVLYRPQLVYFSLSHKFIFLLAFYEDDFAYIHNTLSAL